MIVELLSDNPVLHSRSHVRVPRHNWGVVPILGTSEVESVDIAGNESDFDNFVLEDWFLEGLGTEDGDHGERRQLVRD